MSADGAIVVTRALTLSQPWATLVATGAKQFETRSWPTNYRGWIAIHAAKNVPKEARGLWHQNPRIRIALEEAGYEGQKELPLGCLLCVVRLTDCLDTFTWTPSPASDEYHFGNYAPGRFAFSLDDRRLLKRPPLLRGMLGLWTLPTPLTSGDLL